MTDLDKERIRGEISAAHAEALRVHDSPVRSDQLFKRVEGIAARFSEDDGLDDRSVRAKAALNDALRVLRREDDGREAAKHLQTALRELEVKPRQPSPFLDDL